MAREPKDTKKQDVAETKPASGATGEVEELQTSQAEPEKKKPDLEAKSKGGRPPKYRTEEERREAKNQRQREARAKVTGTRVTTNQTKAADSEPSLQLEPRFFSGLVSTLFSLAGKLRKKEAIYTLRPEEAEAIAAAAIPVIEKHDAVLVGEHAEEINLGLVILSVAGPRVIADFNSRTQGDRQDNSTSKTSVAQTDRPAQTQTQTGNSVRSDGQSNPVS